METCAGILVTFPIVTVRKSCDLKEKKCIVQEIDALALGMSHHLACAIVGITHCTLEEDAHIG